MGRVAEALPIFRKLDYARFLRRPAQKPTMSLGGSMEKLNKWLMAGLVLIAGYYLWSFFVSSRYQALCQLVYWDSTTSEIRSCDDLKTQLESGK